MSSTVASTVTPGALVYPQCKDIGVPEPGEYCYKIIPIHLRIENSNRRLHFDRQEEPSPGFLIIDQEIDVHRRIGNTEGPTATQYQAEAAVSLLQDISEINSDLVNYISNTRAKLKIKDKELLDALSEIERKYQHDSSSTVKLAEQYSSHNYGLRITASAQAKKDNLGWFYKTSGTIDAEVTIYQVYVGTPGQFQALADEARRSVEALLKSPTAPRSWALHATADTYVRADYDVRKNDNYGRECLMQVGTSRRSTVGPLGTPDAMRSLVRFDLSDVEGVVTDARLELSIAHIKSNSNVPFVVGVYRLLGDWDEGNGAEGSLDTVPDAVSADTASGVAWEQIDENNRRQPSFDPKPIATKSVIPESGQPGSVVVWDVTTLVQGWVDDPASNFGLMLRDETTDGGFRELGFGTREGDLYEFPGRVIGPRLIVRQ